MDRSEDELPLVYNMDDYLELESDNMPSLCGMVIPSFKSPTAIAESVAAAETAYATRISSGSRLASRFNTSSIWTGRDDSPMLPDIAPPGLYDSPLNAMVEATAAISDFSLYPIPSTSTTFVSTAVAVSASASATASTSASASASASSSGSTSPVATSLAFTFKNTDFNLSKRGNKRLRTSNVMKKISTYKPYLEEYDTDNNCPICYEPWEQFGDHRLVSLVCGHLFGQQCITRWLMTPSKEPNCPQCKGPAALSDIRILYAKSIKVVNSSEENQLRFNIESLNSNYTHLKSSDLSNQEKIDLLQVENGRLNELIDRSNIEKLYPPNPDVDHINTLLRYKIRLQKKVPFLRKLMTRVMIANPMQKEIIVSEQMHHSQGKFGVNFYDTTTSQMMAACVSVSSKYPRHLSLNCENNIMGTASHESYVKIFDLKSRSEISKLEIVDEEINACAFGDSNNEYAFHVGTDNGLTHMYDTRYKKRPVSQFDFINDDSPIISIITVDSTPIFPYNGFVVMKYNSLWCFYYNGSGELVPVNLNVNGPLVSMSYDRMAHRFIVCAKNIITNMNTRFIVGRLLILYGTVYFYQEVTVAGSMIKTARLASTKIIIDNNILSAGYIHNGKHLVFIDKQNNENLQAVPVKNSILDICQVRHGNNTVVAAMNQYSEFLIYSIKK